MQIKLKIEGDKHVIRLQTAGDIKEVMIGETLTSPSETIAVAFRGDTNSGIIEFTIDEWEKLDNTIKRRLHLIKETKRYHWNPKDVPF